MKNSLCKSVNVPKCIRRRKNNTNFFPHQEKTKVGKYLSKFRSHTENLPIYHVTNCTLERSFSATRRVKTEMRFTMETEKFNSLILLCTQNDITIEIDCNDVINNFTMTKARRNPLLYKYKCSE
ncbi:hypothetical protein TNCV_448741 [Trichonephila clavipes]|nr:hypothetical protein TNCV_448741 [Trichonephila clavipes]